MSKPVIATLAFVAIAGINLTLAENRVEWAFKKSKIVPDVIQVAPKRFLKVTYENCVKPGAGNELTYGQIENEPMVEWEGNAKKFYTLILLGPDVPNSQNPFFREYLHWLVVNISGGNVTSRDVLAVYKNIQLPVSSGLHRNVFLLYQQKGKTTFSMKPIRYHTHQGRPEFNVKTFAKENALGSPIAGNFFNYKPEELRMPVEEIDYASEDNQEY